MQSGKIERETFFEKEDPKKSKRWSCCCFGSSKANRRKHKREFYDAPSFLVVQDIYDRVVEAVKIENEENTLGNEAVSEKYAYFEKLSQKSASTSFEMIEIGHISYDRPVLVIYNPSSGIQIDRRKHITDSFSDLKIKFDLIET